MIDMKLAIERIADTTTRDPRSAPYGYLSGGSFVLDSVCVFQWFSSVEELINHIAEYSPVIYELDEKEAKFFQEEMKSIMLAPYPISDECLSQVNKLSAGFMCIQWWGRFDELTGGPSELARELRSMLREDEGEGSVEDIEMDDFVDVVRGYGC